MIRSFRNQGTEDVFNGEDTKAARKICPREMVKVARRKLQMVDLAVSLNDLKSVGNRLERLKKERDGQHAIRINDQYRICFIWTESGAEEVEITDYH